jgi:cation diffusion facilitator CzcD-associated flavoprotein CzcO
MSATNSENREWDVVVVGAGFAGLYMLYRLRKLGITARVFERGSDIGGTWFWNRYPGARCDIESIEYSYQFSEELQQEWNWTERYASQPEILSYIHHVAERFDLRGGIELDTEISDAHFDEEDRRWILQTNTGHEVRGQFCVMATGCLSQRNTPHWQGLEDYSGKTFHTADWPEEGVDFTGQRVGVIGTGSSAIQSIPIIADQADALTVFQRTAGFTVPAHNAPLDPTIVRGVKAEYSAFRKRNWESLFGTLSDFEAWGPSSKAADPDHREEAFNFAWDSGSTPILLNVFEDLMADKESNDQLVEYATRKIAGIIRDPQLAKQLTPDQVFGCKRLCLDSGYYQTFNRPHVELVTVAHNPIQELTTHGLRLADGTEYPLDAIVFATGFDAMTGALLSVNPRGRNGLSLSERWTDGPKTYLGLGVAGFPNMFTVTGPGSPSVLANMVPAIEQHINWITDCIVFMRERELDTIEADLAAQEAWSKHVNQVADQTLFPQCNSWYLGSNIDGKPKVFMPYIGFGPYVEKCNEVVENGYRGFVLTRQDP